MYAGMMKLVNMLDLGSSAARLVGSSPTTRTKINGHDSHRARFVMLW